MKNTKIEIFNNAKEVFSEKGFKETSIAIITKKTGIGVGTFYNFYFSKEELFLEIFYVESIKLKDEIMKDIDIDDDPVCILKEVISKLFKGMKDNSILREWYNRETFFKILEKVKEGSGNKKEDLFYNFFNDTFKKWQSEGKIRKDIDSEYILALFNSLCFVDLHIEEIGGEFFPKTMDYLVEFIVKGLMV
ncbi:TetR/AcrR family transcriptional regulator [Serpentinicella alkaliphila]|uniref:TetR family transcriptional regulator n=1 Tax=Serpentinicella alkaliphila TaxID=1734049 RepID=A0A4R2TD39_9FIRM|nr:TetR/AcrR family transcriptional regulator [Serpentinicella alkaliphila]QUH26340.1 TetR/AcrR family transcriptional regulator [Serpentinicella alkaliphila]TCP95028.1 TetR family transcriptional regulator [Serpentinicella alkaliphila]